MEIHEKIKQVREILGLNQAEVAEILGTLQNEVSRMESGKKKFVPNNYIQFLIDNNFDLNSFFDKRLSLTKNESSPDISKKKHLLPELESIEPTHLVSFIQDRLDLFKNLDGFKTLIFEASARLKGTDYTKRLERLEAVTAALLLERKSEKPLFSDEKNDGESP
ncbi:helix-turn-helix domain-containing protein [Flagellimonas sp. C4]|uniref:helix-turn-helix domain-containing protein n=1 Tax=Flagellimonas alginolytica TaxID=3177515 RepID=UPI0035C902CA